MEELHGTKVIEGNEHEEYPFDMKRGQELAFPQSMPTTLSILSSVMRRTVDSWLDDGDEDGDEEDEDEGNRSDAARRILG